MPHNLIEIFKNIHLNCMFPLFPPQVLDISYLEVLDFPLFSSFTILEWFSTWNFKYAINTIFTKDINKKLAIYLV